MSGGPSKTEKRKRKEIFVLQTILQISGYLWNLNIQGVIRCSAENMLIMLLLKGG